MPFISRALQGLFVPGAMKYQLSKLGHSQIKAKIGDTFGFKSDTINSLNTSPIISLSLHHFVSCEHLVSE